MQCISYNGTRATARRPALAVVLVDIRERGKAIGRYRTQFAVTCALELFALEALLRIGDVCR